MICLFCARDNGDPAENDFRYDCCNSCFRDKNKRAYWRIGDTEFVLKSRIITKPEVEITLSEIQLLCIRSQNILMRIVRAFKTRYHMWRIKHFEKQLKSFGI